MSNWNADLTQWYSGSECVNRCPAIDEMLGQCIQSVSDHRVAYVDHTLWLLHLCDSYWPFFTKAYDA